MARLSIVSEPIHGWNSFIGIVTAIIGNVLISLALNTQRYAHLKLDRQQQLAEEEFERRTRNASDDASSSSRLDEANNTGAGRRELLDGSQNETDPLLPRKSPAKIQQDEEASEDRDEEKVQAPTQKHYLRSPLWWLGITLMTVGETGNFLAYGFAPASIVSPLGVVALISNCIIAPVMLKESFRSRDFLGVLVAIAGAVIVVLSASSSNPKLGPDEIWEYITAWTFETYLGITLALIVAMMLASPRYGERTILLDVGLVGLFGGYTALATKGVASLLSYNLWRVVTFPITYLLVVVLVSTAVLQIKYVNRALQRFDSTVVIPTQFVLFTISVIVGSAVLYRDFERQSPDDAGKFVGGCMLTFVGVWLITSGRRQRDSASIDEQSDGSSRKVGNTRDRREEALPLLDAEEAFAGESDLSQGNSLAKKRDSLSSKKMQNDAGQHIGDHGDIVSDDAGQAQHQQLDPAMASVPTTDHSSIAPSPQQAYLSPPHTPTPNELALNPWAGVADGSRPQISTTSSSPGFGYLPNTIGTASTSVLPDTAHERQPPQQPVLPAAIPPNSAVRQPAFITTNSDSALPTLSSANTRVSTPIDHHGNLGSRGAFTPERLLALSRRSIDELMPFTSPLTAPLSGSLSAIVADSLRRGVVPSSLHRPVMARRVTRDTAGLQASALAHSLEEDDAIRTQRRTRGGSDGGLNARSPILDAQATMDDDDDDDERSITSAGTARGRSKSMTGRISGLFRKIKHGSSSDSSGPGSTSGGGTA